MKIITLNTEVQVYENTDELKEDDRQLLAEAKSALDDSYSPYSNFRVGAALRLKNGKMVKGSNQENASYPLCLCAERVALAAADSLYPNEPVVAIAITVFNPRQPINQPISPCGACRQVIRETAHKHHHNIRVILHGEKGDVYIIPSEKQLLPLFFDPSVL